MKRHENRLDGTSRSGKAGQTADGDDRAGTFMRALTVGALVGAAIAGSTLISRFRGPGCDGGAAQDGKRGSPCDQDPPRE